MHFDTPARPASRTPSRRQVVTVAALGTVGAGALAACGGGEDEAGVPAGTASTPAAGGESSSAPATESTGSGAPAIAKVADVPVGGAISAQSGGKKIILSRPEEATVVGFDARCPHQGCAVAPAAKNLACPCHNSTFDTSTGERLRGPAKRGLTAFAVTVEGEDIVAG